MLDDVKNYYGETLSGTGDLQTTACCTADAPPQWLKSILVEIHDDVLARYYGCGLILPEALEGLRVLDLGCGAGRDVYVLSKLVGERGEVVGVDMTPQQLAVAREHEDYHRQQFGYKKSNVSFVEGQLESLAGLGLEPASFDVIVSNCVINLCTDKAAVLKAACDLLKPGGEMYFSDVYVDRRVPEPLQKHPVLYGECLSGAFYWNDFHNEAKRCGFLDPRLVSDEPITVENPELAELTADLKFWSATYRLFKMPQLEPACEDYGQAVRYRGSIERHGNGLLLDKHHWIETGRVFPVCGNTWHMLKDSRFAPHFEFIEGAGRHLGIFKGCGTDIPYDGPETGAGGAACC